MKTPWNRVMYTLKAWEAAQNNDGGAGPFFPHPGDTRQVLQEHTELLTLLIEALPYVEEGEEFNKPTGKNLSKKIRASIENMKGN